MLQVMWDDVGWYGCLLIKRMPVSSKGSMGCFSWRRFPICNLDRCLTNTSQASSRLLCTEDCHSCLSCPCWYIQRTEYQSPSGRWSRQRNIVYTLQRLLLQKHQYKKPSLSLYTRKSYLDSAEQEIDRWCRYEGA